MNDRDTRDPLRAKFETGAPPELESSPLPWGYGEERIRALVRSPDSVYFYWEITDRGIEGARSRLGAPGRHGWCCLRVYDTTGRDFDGTNAHHYFDVPIEREAREHFLMVHRPGSSLHVEVGVKTHEGYFQPIARSGRADFPRKSPSPHTWTEWMTVTSDDDVPAARPYQSRHAGGEPPLARQGAGAAARFPSSIEAHLAGQGPSLGPGEWETVEVFGPWRVTIRGFETQRTRRVLASWTMHRVQIMPTFFERWLTGMERRQVGAFRREERFFGASEGWMLLESGASELWLVGASERMWLGASESMAAGASEALGWGSSMLAFAGASEWSLWGASEWYATAASEAWTRLLGGSEQIWSLNRGRG